jgi:hypothetical protein
MLKKLSKIHRWTRVFTDVGDAGREDAVSRDSQRRQA